MTFMKTFDFSDLSTIEINAEMEGFQPRFDNTLALTAYRQQTLILTREGQAVILNCRLQECLCRFRKENGICRHELSAYYSLARCQTQAIISGHYRLVPTHGASNRQVVYYMAHHLDTYSYSQKLNRLLIILKGQGGLYQLRVDASFSSFGRILPYDLGFSPEFIFNSGFGFPSALFAPFSSAGIIEAVVRQSTAYRRGIAVE